MLIKSLSGEEHEEKIGIHENIFAPYQINDFACETTFHANAIVKFEVDDNDSIMTRMNNENIATKNIFRARSLSFAYSLSHIRRSSNICDKSKHFSFSSRAELLVIFCFCNSIASLHCKSLLSEGSNKY
jgi:hypothetical protein